MVQVKNLADKPNTLASLKSVLGVIPDAPANGNEYIRKNNNWVPPSASGIADAPNDGNGYIRKNNSWEISGQNQTGRKPLEQIFKTCLIKNLEADNTLPTDTFVGITRPVHTPMKLVEKQAGNVLIIANMPYIEDLIANPTNWLFWSITTSIVPDSAAKKCTAVEWLGDYSGNKNCYKITTSTLVSGNVNDDMACLTWKAYVNIIKGPLFPRATSSWNATFVQGVPMIWRDKAGLFHAIVGGYNKTKPALPKMLHHHFTAEAIEGPWTDEMAGLDVDMFANQIPAGYVAFGSIINGGKVPGSDLYFMAGNIMTPESVVDLCFVFFSEDLSYKRVVKVNQSGYAYDISLQAWVSGAYYKGQWLIVIADGTSNSGKRKVLKSKFVDGIFSEHSLIFDHNDKEIFGEGSMFGKGVANGSLFVYNNELYYFSSGMALVNKSGNKDNHLCAIFKYNDSNNTWYPVVVPAIVSFHGDGANYEGGYTWGSDHMGVVVPLPLDLGDGKLWMTMAMNYGTDTYQVTIGSIDLE